MTSLELDVDLRGVFDIYELYDKCSYNIGPLRLSGMLLPHYVPNIGVRLEGISDGPGGEHTVLAYTGDTGPTPLLTELGSDVDLYIVEATDRPGELAKEPENRNLMTSAEAGYFASKANAKRLLLTHFWPGNDVAETVENAQEHHGNVLAASPGAVIRF